MEDDFVRPHPVQLHGSALARALLALLGWRVRTDGLPSRQGVFIVYPHTSNWDFVMLVLAKWAVGLPVRFWGKDSLFRIPLLGAWLSWLGGVPVNRSAAHGMVGDMVQTLRQCQATQRFFWLALAPEGTRKWTPGWRSGFYQVALGAGVPLGVCSLNYQHKTVDISQFLRLSGELAADMQRIAAALEDTAGKRAELAAPIRILEK
jgi:1-acyl-sn-glycerol-3-phosphate acyltransferase